MTRFLAITDACARWVGANARNLLACGAFASMVWGFHLAWEPLGYLVPGMIVFAALSYSHLRGESGKEGDRA